jgi:hypothetical protein
MELMGIADMVVVEEENDDCDDDDDETSTAFPTSVSDVE